MSHLSIEEIIPKYGATHLICDSAYPLIINSTLEEEAILYNLPQEVVAKLCAMFADLTGKEIKPVSDIAALSGGQKVVLMTLLALLSSAERIVFVNLPLALDKERSVAVSALIEQFKPLKASILLV